MRRRLAFYNLCLIAGILIGYIFFEKSERIYSIILVIIIILSLNILFNIELIEAKDMKICVSLIFLGFILFGNHYFYFENIYNSIEQNAFAETEAYVKSVEVGKDRIRIVLSDKEGKYLTFTIYSKEKRNQKAFETAKLLSYGDKVIVTGKMSVAEPSRNPGFFNYRLYLKSKKISSVIRIKTIKKISTRYNLIENFRRRLYIKKKEFLSEFSADSETRNFISGVIFGDTSLLEEDVYDEFRKNGTAHVLAVSGLHIGFIVSMLRFMSKARKTFPITILIIFILILYGELTAWNISTVRSEIVAVMSIMSFYLKRPSDLLSSVSTASMIILLKNPYYLFNQGFQMSFLAMLGISFFKNLPENIIDNKLKGMIGIQILMAIYSAFFFNTFNPLSLLINIPIIFIVSLIVPISLILIGINIVSGIWLYSLKSIIMSLSRITLRLNHFLYMGGSISSDIKSMNVIVFSLFISILLFFLSEQVKVWIIRKDKIRLVKSFMVLVILTTIFSLPFVNKFSKDEIVFIDVGQGDAIHVKSGNRFKRNVNIMFDGGGKMDYNIGKKVLKPYFLKNGTNRIDYAFVSHLHTDHYKGLIELSEIFPVKNLYLNNINKKEKSMNVYSLNYIEIGDELKIDDDVKITVLWPNQIRNDDLNKSMDENERNMVLMLNYRGIKVMLTGDLTGEDEKKMLDYYKSEFGTYKPLQCDIIKICHHGSRYSNSEEFLKAIRAKTAVIQVGKNNMYGHPSEEVISRLKDNGVRTYRTDVDGAIGVNIKGSGRYSIDKMIN